MVYPNRSREGFTLIELLVVISIIGILVSLSLFGIQGARKSSRDAERKSDLEAIRSALEMYKADKGFYPQTQGLLAPNYISAVPDDPLSESSDRVYSYNPGGNPAITYTLCAALENQSGSLSGCGSCGSVGCNYKVTNP